MKKYKYYLVSFMHRAGFGNIFFKACPYLDIREAEKEIAKNGYIKPIIITINEITKGQYNKK